MAKLPKHLYSLFWDTNPKDLDPDKYPKYVIERVMELGDIPHLRWMLKYYHRQKLKKVFLETRNLSKRSAPFWANFLKIDPEKTKCLSKEYQKKHPAIWPY